MSALVVNEQDLQSPGYEYLRTYQNMSNLYYKLIALNYQKEFCSLYRCPPIHKYYFSIQSKNSSEQQFLFTCLCAWLIKDKCQMNLELEPEDYEDSDVIIGVILEAFRLLLISDDEYSIREKRDPISFPTNRLKLGFGPEVVWILNVLADRALELLIEDLTEAETSRKMKVIYSNTTRVGSSTNRSQTSSLTSITIGQPFVGGGLTTRPLGSYEIDDKTLLFDSDDDVAKAESRSLGDRQEILYTEATNMIDLFKQVQDKNTQANEPSKILDLIKTTKIETQSFRDYLHSTIESENSIQDFKAQSKMLLNALTNRIDQHLDVIKKRENFLQSNLNDQIVEFLVIWRKYNSEMSRQADLTMQINSKTDKFENYNESLTRLNAQIEARIKELRDGIKLKDLELITKQLKEESDDYDIKIGLLLTVYSKIQSKIASGESKE